MPEWLTTTFAGDARFTLAQLVGRQLVAFTLGCVVAGIYRVTHGRRGPESRGLMATLVLLTVLIGMISSVVGDNVARAFSLVGALSIVRFRTVVEDTRDTAFVIFAVGVGMAVGAGYLAVALVCIPVAGLAAFLFRPRSLDAATEVDRTLVLRVGAAYADDPLARDVMEAHASSLRLVSVSTARQGATFEKAFAIRLRRADAATRLVTELTALEGVQGVELRPA
ncbi:MAG: DUF4956 domain-containing protein [Phycisphaerales bacterium]